MTKIEDIEAAVTKLTPAELKEFRDWFEAFDARHFDQKIEDNANVGRLDALAEEALAEFRKGQAREL